MFFWWWCFSVHRAYSTIFLIILLKWSLVESGNKLFQLFFHLYPFLPTKWAAVYPSSGSAAMCGSTQVTCETAVSGPWRQSEKSDEIAKVYPKSAPLRHTKAYENKSWASTAPKWKLILSRGCVINTYSRSHGIPPKAVPTCEGTAFRHRLTTFIYSRPDFSRHSIIYAQQRCMIQWCC